MSQLEKLKETSTLSDVAQLLGFKPSALSYILYKIPETDKYYEFEIPKKNGDPRKIKAPTEKLKVLQKRLAHLLVDCFEDILRKNNKRSLSHGFRKDHSIITNAKNHKNKRYVFNIDLKDFFPSINFGRVRGFFIKNHHLNLDPKVATVIAQIACHDNELPQGSPCSPIISNYIGHLLDVRMVRLAKRTKCTYSRYVDDITFSTNNKQFPKNIAIEKEENSWIVGKCLGKEIVKSGFLVNTKKTSMQYRTERQMTTGLVVNEKVNIRKEYYRKARSMCNELFQKGEFYIGREINHDTNQLDYNFGTLEQLEGILSYIYQIKRPYDAASFTDRRTKPTSISKMYRDLLVYKYYICSDIPVVITEGDTDVIYLKTSLRELASEYIDLIGESDHGFQYKIKFINRTNNYNDIFSIATGTSGLRQIMWMYAKYMKRFDKIKKANPVILLIDNDNGSNKIRSSLKNDWLIENEIYHFENNLYLLFTPKQVNREIEDLFDTKTLNTVINGKRFSRAKSIDTSREYGKTIFANKVVKERHKEIDFSRFRSIYDNIRFIVADYKRIAGA